MFKSFSVVPEDGHIYSRHDDWVALAAAKYDIGSEDTTLSDGSQATAVSLAKKYEADLYGFDDGLLMTFPQSKPKHLSFYCKSSEAEEESCDLKLFRINRNDDSFVAAPSKRALQNLR